MTTVSLLTGGDDPTYAIPLAAALADRGIQVEFVGNDAMAGAADLRKPNIRYVNLRGDQDPRAAVGTKVARVLRYYTDLVSYTATTEASIFHILWLNKFETLDRTLLNLLYRRRGKKVVFTAHNVNARKRDGTDSVLNRATLRAMYAIVDHIFVHTELSKAELIDDFRVSPTNITVIPFGLNTLVPDTPLSRIEARRALGLAAGDEVLLFFGQIAPYKGVDILIEAFARLSQMRPRARLIVAGRAKAGAEAYWRPLKPRLESPPLRERVLLKNGFIPDDEIAVLFTAADALILPYRAIYQSGPLSIAYRFGVPVIATRVGSFDRDVMAGVTGLLCEPEDPADLARVLGRYLDGELCADGERTRERIQAVAHANYSWDQIARKITDVYAKLCGR